MEVDLRAGRRGMPEQGLRLIEGTAGVHDVAPEPVPQHMGVNLPGQARPP